MALKNFMAMGEKATEGGKSAPKSTLRGHRTVSPATCIDDTTEVSGKLRCKETIRIDGRLEGELHCDQTVIVGESACLKALIHADSVVIAGEVKGDISARRKITLEKSARVTGDLTTPGIVIEEGAKLEGRIEIGAREAQATEKATAARPAPKSRAASGPAPVAQEAPTAAAS